MHDLKEMRGQQKLKKETLDCTHILLQLAKQFTLKEGYLKYQALKGSQCSTSAIKSQI